MKVKEFEVKKVVLKRVLFQNDYREVIKRLQKNNISFNLYQHPCKLVLHIVSEFNAN